MLAPSPSFSTLLQGLLLLSTLLATANATNVWKTAPNTAVFYCGEDGKGKATGVKAMVWATKGAKTSPYAKGHPEYQSMQTVGMVQLANKEPKVGAAESKLFAQGASGVVRLFEDKLSADAMKDGVWKQYEEPALIANAAVTALHVLDPDDPSIEYIVWERKGGKVVYRDAKLTKTGLPISKLEEFEIAWQPATPPGSPKISPKGSPKASPKASPKVAAKVLPKAGSPSRSASKSPTRPKVRRFIQF